MVADFLLIRYLSHLGELDFFFFFALNFTGKILDNLHIKQERRKTMKIKSFIYFLFTTFILSQFSCEVNVVPTSNSNNRYKTSDTLDILLISDPLVQELLSIRDSFTERINNKLGDSFSLENLRLAYLNSDENLIISYLGFTSAQIDSIGERLNTIRIELLNKYPTLNSYLTSECVSCNIDSFFSHYYDYTSIYTEALDCRWGPYIASLLLCTTLGPVLYWPCAYVAMCSWCSGGILNYICQIEFITTNKNYSYLNKMSHNTMLI
mgnify:CR=1 FL=1